MTDSCAHAMPFKRSSMPASANASPARKKARLSSPSSPLDDVDFPELDSDGLAALDELEQRHTQQTQERERLARASQSSPTPQPRSVRFTSASATKAQAGTTLPLAASMDIFFVRPSISMNDASVSRSPSPEPGVGESFLGNATSTELPSFAFASGRKLSISELALEKAAVKFRAWAEEDEKKQGDEANSSTTNILKTINNIAPDARPSTPKQSMAVPVAPALFSRPVAGSDPIRARAYSTAAILRREDLHSSEAPSSPAPIRPASALPNALATTATSSPRMLGTTPRAKALGTTRRRFATPFKPGFGPAQSTSSTPQIKAPAPPLVQKITPVAAATSAQATITPAKVSHTPDSARPTLAIAGVQIGTRTKDVLIGLGIPSYIFTITTHNAQDFVFIPSSTGSSAQAEPLNTQAALAQLLAAGCKHATQQWVDNHWRLILWKLSGMIINDADPYDALIRRWNWEEVMRQLSHRYKREFIDGARPALRAILERDAHAGAPMVLCISAIEWTPAQKRDDGSVTEASATLELTDGWYFVRASVDDAILRAIKRSMLKVGRKIACAGARLDPPHQDGKDAFSAYSSCCLVLSGNGSAIAPWHAKLGFHSQGFTACLRSLTADGGVVPLLDVTVVKAYPMAFYETMPDGSRGGPWNEAEEREAQDKWRIRREREHQKLVQEFDKKAFVAQGLLDKLKRAAGNSFKPGDDECMPDHIEDLYDEIEEDPNVGARLRTISSCDAGWMAVYLQDKLEKDRERIAFDIESELAANCPERSVRSFRLVRVRDTYSVRRPTTRTAQLTVWDASQLDKDMLVSGARLQITNVVPEQPRAWCALSDADGEIFLVTRRNSRLKRMPEI